MNLDQESSLFTFHSSLFTIGHETPALADPTGEAFAFEAGAGKTSGGQGFADVWKRGHFAWEYKGKHADLDKAYQQLLQYREALENPPLLVVSDIEQIVIHTNFTNTVKQIYTLTFDDLLTPQGLDPLKAVFYDPRHLRARKTIAQATEEAAAEFASLAELLRQYGEDPRQTAHFLIRLLFCLFPKISTCCPTWLDLAHKKLDEVVFAAYGWPSDLSDEEILERLLALNLARAGAQ